MTASAPALNPAAINLDDLARVLTATGGQVITADMLQADVADGAPTNADGTMNLVHYTAWLMRELAHGV